MVRGEPPHLQLNIGKTKELVVDFRRSKKPPTPITIQGVEIETMDTYKFLGVHINNKLDWTDNTEALYRKSQSSIFFLRRLRSFDMCGRLLKMFYHSGVTSTMFFSGCMYVYICVCLCICICVYVYTGAGHIIRIS